MTNNYIPEICNLQFKLRRSKKSTFTSVNVLTTDYKQNERALQFVANVEKLKALHPRYWFLHYVAVGDDARELVQRVPKCMAALNRSRVLRRERVTGVRACNIDISKRRPKYVTDMFFTNFSGSAVIASGLLKYLNATYFKVSFVTPLGMCRRDLQALHKRYYDEFMRRSKLSSYSVDIRFDNEESICSLLTWFVQSPSIDLLSLATTMQRIFGEQIQEIEFARNDDKLIISRASQFDVEEYSRRPIDKVILGFTFRSYMSFGVLHHNSEYTIY